MQKIRTTFLSVLLILLISLTPRAAHAETESSPNFSTSAELIEAVNVLRISKGLPAYQPDSILMGLAQSHAEYMAAVGMSNIHIDARGFLPFQRALDAGYSVAGDIYSNVGFFSENVTGGVGKTAQDAVEEWMLDAPHRGTMLSSDLRDVGAGVAVEGKTYYYCLDAGQSTGGTPRPFTLPPSYNPPKPTMVPNTPNADGSITYFVQPDDTTLGIALSYGLSLADLLTQNGLTEKSVIYPDQKIIIRPAYTPTPTLPTLTPTTLPTITSWPTSTPTFTRTPFPPTSTPTSGLPVSTTREAVIVIVITALVIAALITLFGKRRE
jgi:uncharacterized protein YkwD